MIGRSGSAILCHLSSSCLREPTGCPRSLSVFPIPIPPRTAAGRLVVGTDIYTRRLASPDSTIHRPPILIPVRLSFWPSTVHRSFLFLPSNDVAFHHRRAVLDKSFSSNRTYGFLPQVAIERWSEANIFQFGGIDVYLLRKTDSAVIFLFYSPCLIV